MDFFLPYRSFVSILWLLIQGFYVNVCISASAFISYAFSSALYLVLSYSNLFSFYLILFHYYFLDTCMFSKEWKGCWYKWEWRGGKNWEESGRESHNQNITYKKSVLNERLRRNSQRNNVFNTEGKETLIHELENAMERN